MNQDNNWKTKIIFLGGILGALTGVGTAYYIVKRAEKYDEHPVLNTNAIMKLMLLILGTVRQITQLTDKES